MAGLTGRAITRRLVIVLGTYVCAGGFLSFLGWSLDVNRLTDWDGNGISIQPNATLCATAAGLALLALGRGLDRVAVWFGAFIAAIGTATLFQWVSGLNLGIDSVAMFGRQWGRVGVLSPGRMGPPGSVCWTLIGTALVLGGLDRKRFQRAIQLLAMTVTAISALSLVGYLYRASVLYTLPRLSIIALQTATFIFATGVSLIALTSEVGLGALFRRPDAAGVIARRVIAPIVIVPVTLGFMRLTGERLGLYDTAFGVALLTICNVAFLIALLLSTARAVARLEDSRRNAEGSLQRTQAELALLTGTTPVLLTRCSRDLKYQFVNKAAADILGMRAELIVGRPVAEVIGAQAFTTIKPFVDRVLAGETVDYEALIPYPHRGPRWMHVHYLPDWAPDGRVDGWIGSITDITEQKQVEHALRESERAQRLLADIGALTTQVFNTAGVPVSLQFEICQRVAIALGVSRCGLALVDLEAGQVTVAAEAAFGLEPVHGAFPLQQYGTQIVDDGKAGVTTVILDLVSDPRTAARYTDVFGPLGVRAHINVPLHRDGKWIANFWVSSASPRAWSEAEISLVRAVGDRVWMVNEKLRVTAELVASREQLKDHDRRKDEFLAMLAHELRNPLGPIRNAVHLLRIDPAGEAATRARDVIDRQLASLIRIVDDLLEVSRIANGKIQVRRQRVELSAIVGSAVETTRELIDARGHRLTIELPPQSVELDGDPIRLSQVLSNLLSNAAKYTPEGGAIAVKAIRDNGQVRISVRDTGIGIPAHMLEEVFTLFRQVDQSFERTTGGLGIGLHLVKRLVDLHGGTVKAFSEGRGSEFVVTLPVSSRPEQRPAVPAADADVAPVKARRVLIVDDNSDSVETLSALLRQAGHEVAAAYDGDAAIEKSLSWRPDTVVLDIGLPRRNGYDTCRAIRGLALDYPIQVVALTGWSQEHDKAAAMAAGFDEHLVKPVDFQMLARVIGRQGLGVS